jgi:hypothetical protein
MDLRTTAEKNRQAKHNRICNNYLNLVNQYPNTAPSRLMDAIAKEEGMTLQGVKTILVQNGVYVIKNK